MHAHTRLLGLAGPFHATIDLQHLWAVYLNFLFFFLILSCLQMVFVCQFCGVVGECAAHGTAGTQWLTLFQTLVKCSFKFSPQFYRNLENNGYLRRTWKPLLMNPQERKVLLCWTMQLVTPSLSGSPHHPHNLSGIFG